MKKFYQIFYFLIIIFTLFSCSNNQKCPVCPAQKQIFFQSFRNGLLPSSSYNGIQDACVYQEQPSTNYGTAGFLIAGYQPGGGEWYSMIRFDISSIPQQAKITKAYLFLKIGGVNGGPVTLEFYTLKNYDWQQNAINYNNWVSNGSYDKLLASQTFTATMSDQISIELNNNIFQDFISFPSENFGIFIKGTINTGSSDNYVLFRSSEYSVMSYTPLLTVYYTLD